MPWMAATTFLPSYPLRHDFFLLRHRSADESVFCELEKDKYDSLRGISISQEPSQPLGNSLRILQSLVSTQHSLRLAHTMSLCLVCSEPSGAPCDVCASPTCHVCLYQYWAARATHLRQAVAARRADAPSPDSQSQARLRSSGFVPCPFCRTPLIKVGHGAASRFAASGGK